MEGREWNVVREKNDDVDSQIRHFVAGERYLTYDRKTHDAIRSLVELVGWDDARKEVIAASASGKRFAASYALEVVKHRLATKNAANGAIIASARKLIEDKAAKGVKS